MIFNVVIFCKGEQCIFTNFYEGFWNRVNQFLEKLGVSGQEPIGKLVVSPFKVTHTCATIYGRVPRESRLMIIKTESPPRRPIIFVSLLVSLFVCLFVCLFIYLFICLFVYLCAMNTAMCILYCQSELESDSRIRSLNVKQNFSVFFLFPEI